jgi:hypothetical protein
MLSSETLVDSLKGQEVVLPDLFKIFTGWVPVAVNPYYRKLKTVADERLERYVFETTAPKVFCSKRIAAFSATSVR